MQSLTITSEYSVNNLKSNIRKEIEEEFSQMVFTDIDDVLDSLDHIRDTITNDIHSFTFYPQAYDDQLFFLLDHSFALETEDEGDFLRDKIENLLQDCFSFSFVDLINEQSWIKFEIFCVNYINEIINEIRYLLDDQYTFNYKGKTFSSESEVYQILFCKIDLDNRDFLGRYKNSLDCLRFHETVTVDLVNGWSERPDPYINLELKFIDLEIKIFTK